MSDVAGAAADRPRRSSPAMRGYLRADGRKGIRNYVRRRLSRRMRASRRAAASPSPSRSAARSSSASPAAIRAPMRIASWRRCARIPMSVRCCSSRSAARSSAAARCSRRCAKSGRPAELLVIQEDGGTRATIEAGRAWVEARLAEAAAAPTVPLALLRPRHRHEMRRLGRALSGITANPAVGQRLRPPRRCRRDADVRGDLRADRLRGAHGRPRRHARARRARSSPRSRRPTPTTATSAMRASAAATSSTASRRSRRSRSAPMPRAARGRSRPAQARRPAAGVPASI